MKYFVFKREQSRHASLLFLNLSETEPLFSSNTRATTENFAHSSLRFSRKQERRHDAISTSKSGPPDTPMPKLNGVAGKTLESGPPDTPMPKLNGVAGKTLESGPPDTPMPKLNGSAAVKTEPRSADTPMPNLDGAAAVKTEPRPPATPVPKLNGAADEGDDDIQIIEASEEAPPDKRYVPVYDPRAQAMTVFDPELEELDLESPDPDEEILPQWAQDYWDLKKKT
ncbi:Protein SON [Folsomia candida]|uniref:Protein SON n=1 Tax=Folsomia candida TaxID=158441 RepID=A0A226DDT1_FOLCA|nr:Protein SON [Folsomia candida]